jgi:hypothetical protein
MYEDPTAPPPYRASRFARGVRMFRSAPRSVCLRSGDRSGRQIVGEVLAKERPAGLDVRVVLAGAAVAEPAGSTDPAQQLLVGLERREVEHPPVTPTIGNGRVQALGRKAVITQLGGSGRDDRSASCVK